MVPNAERRNTVPTKLRRRLFKRKRRDAAAGSQSRLYPSEKRTETRHLEPETGPDALPTALSHPGLLLGWRATDAADEETPLVHVYTPQMPTRQQMDSTETSTPDIQIADTVLPVHHNGPYCLV